MAVLPAAGTRPQWPQALQNADEIALIISWRISCVARGLAYPYAGFLLPEAAAFVPMPADRPDLPGDNPVEHLDLVPQRRASWEGASTGAASLLIVCLQRTGQPPEVLALRDVALHELGDLGRHPRVSAGLPQQPGPLGAALVFLLRSRTTRRHRRGRFPGTSRILGRLVPPPPLPPARNYRPGAHQPSARGHTASSRPSMLRGHQPCGGSGALGRSCRSLFRQL